MMYDQGHHPGWASDSSDPLGSEELGASPHPLLVLSDALVSAPREKVLDKVASAPPSTVIFPSGGSVRSNSSASLSAASRSARRSWADLNEDSSGDDLWTPSSSQAPRTPAEDARFWAEASSTAASSDSDRPLHVVNAAAWAVPLIEERPNSSGSEQLLEPARAPIWSEGSAGHDEGKCHPCIFYPKAAGCDNGPACAFCHLGHESRVRHRRHMRRRRGRSQKDDDTADSESARQTSAKDSDDGSLRGVSPKNSDCGSVRSGKSVRSEVSEKKVTFMLPSALLSAQLPAHREPPNNFPPPGARKGAMRNQKSSASSTADTEAHSSQGGSSSAWTSFLAPLYGGTTGEASISMTSEAPNSSSDVKSEAHSSSNGGYSNTEQQGARKAHPNHGRRGRALRKFVQTSR
jgi:hypothetical protein